MPILQMKKWRLSDLPVGTECGGSLLTQVALTWKALESMRYFSVMAFHWNYFYLESDWEGKGESLLSPTVASTMLSI